MIVHPADKVRAITLAFGKTGMGKTFWTQGYARTLRRCIIMDPLMEYRDAVPFDSLPDLIDHCAKYKLWRVSYSDVEDFPMLCRLASAAGDCTLVVEEAQRILPPGLLVPEFAELVYRGRHTRTSLCIVAQRPTTLHIAARSQWTRIVTFSQSEGSDVGWMQKTSGFDFDPAELRRGDYFDVTPGDYERKKLDIPGRRATLQESGKPDDSGKGDA